MKATVSPLLALKFISLSTYPSAPGYLKLTLRNSTSPTLVESAPVRVPSMILGFVFKTSIIRFADTVALGSSMNIMVSIMNDIITCIAYDVNTTMSLKIPRRSVMAALFIKTAPIQYIESVRPFMIIVIPGLRMAMTLLANRLVLVTLSFATSNLSS